MVDTTASLEPNTFRQLQQRAMDANLPLEAETSRLLAEAARTLPAKGQRYVVLTGEQLATLETILGGGSVLHAADLLKKVERLAGVSFRHVRLPFTPNQLELLEEKASRQSLTVQQLVERTAPRIYEQFFDLIARS